MIRTDALVSRSTFPVPTSLAEWYPIKALLKRLLGDTIVVDRKGRTVPRQRCAHTDEMSLSEMFEQHVRIIGSKGCVVHWPNKFVRDFIRHAAQDCSAEGRP
jgi:hypothetical protein